MPHTTSLERLGYVKISYVSALNLRCNAWAGPASH